MNLQLENKRALITGSTGGIGAAIAKVLAREGATIVVHGKDDPERAEQVVGAIENAGGRAVAVVGDLSSDEEARRVADKVFAALGGVDILINNAGIYGNSGWMDTAPDDWTRIYNINVVSMVRLIRFVVPAMKQNGWGRIIEIASGEAMQPFSQMPHYAATKAAAVNLTVSLAKELAGTGITVNAVSPGVIVNDQIKTFFTEVAKQKGWGTEWREIEQNVLKNWVSTLTNTLGKVEDVGNLVAYLSSPLADYVNAANFRVDGGSFL